jgi:dTDP-4-amino-4,6-dideoxygalactose transaminase
MGQRWNYREGQLPVTEDISRRLLRLPMYFGLRAEDQQRVIEQIEQFFRGRSQ